MTALRHLTVDRLLSTVLKNSSDSTLNSHSYGYNLGNQRAALTNTPGDYRSYGYDKIGQLKTALGKEPGRTTHRMHEQFGYSYDTAGNLSYRTNNLLVESFAVDSLNELSSATYPPGTITVAGTTSSAATNVTVNSSDAIRYADNTFARTNISRLIGTNTFTAIAKDNLARADTNTATAYLPGVVYFTYDLNGNLLSDGQRAFDYDDENELIRITVTNAWKSEFSYDGKMRRRVRKEYTWKSGTWNLQSEIRYV